MAYKITQWELSNIPDEQINDADKVSMFRETGLKTVKITDAIQRGNDEVRPNLRNTYSISIECIEGGIDAGAKATLTYWLREKDNSNLFSSKTLGTMQSLGKSIFGNDFPNRAIPFPGDIIGAVVMADIDISNPDQQGRVFTRVFRFEPASQDFMAFSSIEQNYREVINANPGGQA